MRPLFNRAWMPVLAAAPFAFWGLWAAGQAAPAQGSAAEQTAARIGPATLTLQLGRPGAHVSPTLYGLMTEEINHAFDGGLYAELVRNRALKDDPDQPTAWSAGNLGSVIALDKTTGPSDALGVSLKWTAVFADAKHPARITNAGYWGMPVRPNTVYSGSFYAKSDSPAVGGIAFDLINNRTGLPAATAEAPAIGASWKRYAFTLTTGAVEASGDNNLVLSVTHPGTVWLSLVSLFPPTYANRANGNRVDIMEKLAAMQPAFLRFPGGNYLEGDHIAERYIWKQTIGPLVDRPTHPSPWRYHSSDGMGLLEFLEWCEDLHMQPVLAVYGGYSMRQEHIAPGTDLDPYVQDALDEIEYVTGGAGSKWGGERAKDGHPKAFPLVYVEIGNEDNFDRSESYSGRYWQFFQAIKKTHPKLQIIATAKVSAGPGGQQPDVIDDHYYYNAERFYRSVHHYDETDRKGPKIFVGEWATEEGQPTPNFNAALGDAAWMTGMERNSDIIVMASYAPLLVNVNPGARQWGTNLIGYDDLASYGSPSYYAQVMFREYLGNEIVPGQLDSADPRLFYSATRDTKNGRLYIKIVNAATNAQPVRLSLAGAGRVAAESTLVTLSAEKPTDTNSITEPEKIVPVKTSLSGASAEFDHTFPPLSISVLALSVK